MFQGHTNANLGLLVNAIVVKICKITQLKKKHLKVEDLHKLKEY